MSRRRPPNGVLVNNSVQLHCVHLQEYRFQTHLKPQFSLMSGSLHSMGGSSLTLTNAATLKGCTSSTKVFFPGFRTTLKMPAAVISLGLQALPNSLGCMTLLLWQYSVGLAYGLALARVLWSARTPAPLQALSHPYGPQTISFRSNF